MREALDICELAAQAVAAVDLRALNPDELALGAIGLQRHLDRIKALHALVLTEADRACVWHGSGARDIADWMAGQCNASYGEAIGRVRLGDTLERSPALAEAVANGEMSTATAEALHHVIAAPPSGADLNELVDAVKGAGPREAKAAAERWKEIHTTETDAEREDRCYRKRSVRSSPPVDGLVTTTVVLPVLQSRQFINAISHVGGKPDESDGRTTEQRLADGLVQLCAAHAKGQVTGGRERPTILITVDAATLAGLNDQPGVTAQGDRIPADVVRQLSEHATLQRVLQAGSIPLDLGREVRFATEAQYRALFARDGGCRWPGCSIPAAWCEVDHLIPFAEGGRSDLDNEVLWCTHHHHEKHRPGVHVIGDANDLRLRLVDGRTLECPPKGRRATAAA